MWNCSFELGSKTKYMKRRKITISIDLWVQSILIFLLIYFIYIIPKGGLGALLLIAYVGIWQVISAIIWVWFIDKIRQVYLLIVIIVYGIIWPFCEMYQPTLLDKIQIIFKIFNPILLGLCYYAYSWFDFVKIMKLRKLP